MLVEIEYSSSLHVTYGLLLQAERVAFLFPHSRRLNGFTSCETATCITVMMFFGIFHFLPVFSGRKWKKPFSSRRPGRNRFLPEETKPCPARSYYGNIISVSKVIFKMTALLKDGLAKYDISAG